MTHFSEQTQKKSKKIARWLSHLGKLYTKADFYTRQKLISLLLKDKAVLEPYHFHYAASTPTKIIFNLEPVTKDSSSKIENLEDPNFKKIWSAEKADGRLLDSEQLVRIIAFLRDFYRLVT
ncbi:MAG: hypothetical protein J4F31_04125 [Flavobacteriales bacterium]|nr:hypothetical protein [Flavobacteriales bacterium]